jgi:DNA ligase-4
VQRLAHPPQSRSDPSKPIAPERIFASWLAHHPQPFAPGTGKRIFRLLFPHEGARRRYGLKETLLSRELSRALGVPRAELDKWDKVDDGGEGGGEGCLGLAVMAAMADRVCACHLG